MKLKSLLILIIAIAIGGVAYYLSTSPKEGLIGDSSYLVPGLSKQLNDVTKLTIVEAGNSLVASINKSENSWVVENREGYEADFAKVREVFNSLAEAKLIETKTSNSENYSKLGVEDIADSNAQGVQFSIVGLSEPIAIIAGNKGSTGKSSQYIRRVGDKQSWLINKKLNLNQDVTQWLRKDIIDIPPERIKNIQIKHIDGSVVTIENKGTEDYEFALINAIPEGEIVSESEVYQVANALTSLQLSDVASLEKLNVENIESTIAVFNTYDGLTITATTFSIADEIYSILDLEFNADNIDESIDREKNQSDPAANIDPRAAQELVNKAAPRLKGWAFVLPSITQEALTKKLESFTLKEDV